MYRLMMLSWACVYVCVSYGNEVGEAGYHRPAAADGLTIVTYEAGSTALQDGTSPLTSPPKTVSLSPYTGYSPLFPDGSENEFNAVLSPLAPQNSQEQLAEVRLELSGFSSLEQEQQRRRTRKKYCCVVVSCVGAWGLGALAFFLAHKYAYHN